MHKEIKTAEEAGEWLKANPMEVIFSWRSSFKSTESDDADDGRLAEAWGNRWNPDLTRFQYAPHRTRYQEWIDSDFPGSYRNPDNVFNFHSYRSAPIEELGPLFDHRYNQEGV